MNTQTKRKAPSKPAVATLAKTIRINALSACCLALATLDHEDDASFAAAVQIAVAGAGFSASELGRALSYDTGTIIKWYQGVMAPPRAVARQEVIEVIKVLVERRLGEWKAAETSADAIRNTGQRGRSSQPTLRWKAVEHEHA